MRQRFKSKINGSQNKVIQSRVKQKFCQHCGYKLGFVGYCGDDCAHDLGNIFIPLEDEKVLKV